MARFELATALTNIDAALKAAREECARLETARDLITAEGEKAITLLDVLQQFGKAPKQAGTNGHAPTTAVPPFADLPKDASQSDMMESIVTHAPKPLRAEDVYAHFKDAGIKIDKGYVSSSLSYLAKSHRIKRVSTGLYWRLGNGKGAQIADQMAARLPAKADGKPLGAKAIHAKLVGDVERILANASEPISSRQIMESLQAEHFPFKKGNDAMAAVTRAIGKLGKKVKKHGAIGPTRTWSHA